jgi:hypothetical protein
MMNSITRKIISIVAVVFIFAFSKAQDSSSIRSSNNTETNKPKPFRVITEGKRITIQSNQNIQRLMAWTSTGHRFAEQTGIDSQTCSFTVPGNEKFVFVMILLKNGKHYTEKIGVQ